MASNKKMIIRRGRVNGKTPLYYEYWKKNLKAGTKYGIDLFKMQEVETVEESTEVRTVFEEEERLRVVKLKDEDPTDYDKRNNAFLKAVAKAETKAKKEKKEFNPLKPGVELPEGTKTELYIVRNPVKQQVSIETPTTTVKKVSYKTVEVHCKLMPFQVVQTVREFTK